VLRWLRLDLLHPGLRLHQLDLMDPVLRWLRLDPVLRWLRLDPEIRWVLSDLKVHLRDLRDLRDRRGRLGQLSLRHR
jgi:hypothetical protein